MYDVNRTMTPVMKKLDEQVDKGISSSNIDWMCKLSEIGKNIKKIEYYDSVIEEMKTGYSNNDGYSERRHRDSMGRYSREGGNSYGGNSYEGDGSYRVGRGGSSRNGGYSGYSEARGEYMDAKQSYRYSRSPESKHDMNVSLEECMHKLKEELDEMEANADTREEREKIKEMRREIGKLA